MNSTFVSFPQFGIEEWEMNKVAFTLFGKLQVRWYGLIITTGIFLAFLYVIWRGKKQDRVTSDDIIDIGLLTVVLGVIGARAYYVLTSLENYHSLRDAFAIWEGGLGIYGGIIGGCLGIVIVCIRKKIPWRKLFDMAAPGVMIAQALGRWGNFINGEAYGYAIGDTTRFFFFNKELVLSSGEGTIFNFLRMGLRQGGVWTFYHPTFLYESLWNVLGFVLVNLFYKHKKFHGQIALMYFTWYGFGRMFIEGFRTDSLYVPGTDLRISQCVGLICFVVGGVLLLVFSILTRHNTPLLQLADAEAEATEMPAEANEEESEADTDAAEDAQEEAEETDETEKTEEKEKPSLLQSVESVLLEQKKRSSEEEETNGNEN